MNSTANLCGVPYQATYIIIKELLLKWVTGVSFLAMCGSISIKCFCLSKTNSVFTIITNRIGNTLYDVKS